MRKPFFRKLNLEELERLVMPNLFFGQVGTPVSGLPSSNSGAPGLDGSTLVSLNAITSNASDGQADRWLVTDSGNSNADGSAGPIGAPAPSASPTITSGSSDSSANHNFRTPGNCGGCPVHFDPFAENVFDFAFSAGKPASLVLGGGDDGGMSLGNRISASSAGLDAGFGSSSASGGFSGGIPVKTLLMPMASTAILGYGQDLQMALSVHNSKAWLTCML